MKASQSKKASIKKYIQFLVLLISCSFIQFIGCKKENSSEPKKQISEENQLKYFGFVLIDTYWDDPTDSLQKTNYLDELYQFSNLADILVVHPSDDIKGRMQAMKDKNVNCILHLNELFFEIAGKNSPSGVKYQLRSDFRSRWDAFVSTNNLSENYAQVKAFYMGEEPTWNGITFKELETASNYVKQSIPDVAIMLVEAAPAIEALKIPESVDWVGFDSYFIKSPDENQNYLASLNQLKSKFSTDKQKLVIVMDAHYIPAVHGTYAKIKLKEMDKVANSYYKLAKTEPKTIALLAYFWPNGFDDSTALGARGMPKQIKVNYKRIGKEISRK